ncbi:MAG: hypothetical protein DI535_09130 [Citrobacter freundii]|nr:MAG: hypothetical protein DI535_09130 [Citrobacter freundii]
MKQLFVFFITLILFSSCQSQQSKAMDDQKKAHKVLGKADQGKIVTSPGGWTMTATLNGKPWKASSMFPPEASGRIIGYLNDQSISLPFKKSKMVAGKTDVFSSTNVVDILMDDEVKIWAGTEGEMTITSVTNGWIEGEFRVTARDGNKILTITGGHFKVKTDN